MKLARILKQAALAAFFVPVISGCSGLDAKQQYDLAVMQLEKRQEVIKPVLMLECGDKPCQFERLEVHSEIVQQQAVAQQIQLPESVWQTAVKEMGLTSRALISTSGQLAGQASPLYFMADIATAGIRGAGDHVVTDNTHDPTVVHQPGPVVVDPVVVQQMPLVVDPVVVPQYLAPVADQ